MIILFLGDKQMKNEKIVDALNIYKPHEQLVLICSRYQLGEEEKSYLKELILRYDMDWSSFLGAALINRVNGVVYKYIKECNGVPGYVNYFLKVAFTEQKKRTALHQQSIAEIVELFEKEQITYSLLKGAVLNTVFYKAGERISNDTDMMVDVKDLDKAAKILKDVGYIQGYIIDGELVPATKKEILFARLNTYEIVPLIKPVDEIHLPYHEVDINFRLSNDDTQEKSSELLSNTIVMEGNGYNIRTLSFEYFFLFLCVHHYREATMVFKIQDGSDLTLYKFMDIHFLISQRANEINWDKLLVICKNLDRLNDVYYTMYYAEMLYPGTFDTEILGKFKPGNVEYLNEYRGRDNTNEVYQWKTDFAHRAFSWGRRVEAMMNIAEENNRFKDIRQQLKN
jgi:hypothetical protein